MLSVAAVFGLYEEPPAVSKERREAFEVLIMSGEEFFEQLPPIMLGEEFFSGGHKELITQAAGETKENTPCRPELDPVPSTQSKSISQKRAAGLAANAKRVARSMAAVVQNFSRNRGGRAALKYGQDPSKGSADTMYWGSNPSVNRAGGGGECDQEVCGFCTSDKPLIMGKPQQARAAITPKMNASGSVLARVEVIENMVALER
jgi:hypothetical protein